MTLKELAEAESLESLDKRMRQLDSEQILGKPNENATKPVVLTVDDDATNCKIIRRGLINYFDVLMAASGRECLDIIKRQHVDIILLDIMMPEMSGYEVLERLPKDKYIPVICVSGKTETDSIKKALVIGATDYVTKPFSNEELLVRINTHLRLSEAMHKAQASEKNLQKLSEDLEETVTMRTAELKEAYNDLKRSQSQILQQEKMAAIGQLAAGIAHEINNPIGYVNSNLSTLNKYVDKYNAYLAAQAHALAHPGDPHELDILVQKRKTMKMDFIVSDINGVIKESLEGVDRVARIVANLKSFTNTNESEKKSANINDCIECTMDLIHNELMYKADVHKEFGELPDTVCFPLQLNQVFLNILMNSMQSIAQHGNITIKTWHDEGFIFIAIVDDGHGIEKDDLSRIFDPFFTTKDVGDGTGLGLSMTYDIIKRHNGIISVESKIREGTTFTIKVPVASYGDLD